MATQGNPTKKRAKRLYTIRGVFLPLPDTEVTQ